MNLNPFSLIGKAVGKIGKVVVSTPGAIVDNVAKPLVNGVKAGYSETTDKIEPTETEVK